MPGQAGPGLGAWLGRESARAGRRTWLAGPALRARTVVGPGQAPIRAERRWGRQTESDEEQRRAWPGQAGPGRRGS